MQDLSGRQLGKYVLDRPLGRGGMAVVWLGHDAALNRPVAIKVLDPATTLEPGAVERFRREAILAANLEHPHIMPVYDVQEADGLWYIAMRYVPGESLREILNREGALPLDRILPIIRPVAAALDQAHSQGVVHRDVKPGNILVEPDGNVVLTDFGIARAGADAHLTRAGQVMGTADYLAPEQIAGGEASAAGDLYSLAVVLYEMLTGRTPFEGETPAETLYKQVNAPPPPLRSLRRDLPAALQPIMDRAMEKNPALRYPSGAALVGALAPVLSGGPVARVNLSEVRESPAPLLTPTPATGEQGGVVGAPCTAPASGGVPISTGPIIQPITTNPGRGRLVLGGVALVVLLGLGALAFAFLRPGTPGVGGGGNGGTGGAGGPAFAAPAQQAGNVQLRQNGDTTLHANHANRAPTIDGKLDDWTGAVTWPAAFALDDPKLKPPNSAGDLSAAFLLGYDDTNFYLGATITDNVHVQNNLTRALELYKGDDIELWFDTDLAGDFTRDPGDDDDVQIGLSPGDFGSLREEAVQFRPTTAPGISGARVAARARPGGVGYTLEAALPWAALHLAKPPTPGSAIGFCASAGDNDAPDSAQQQKMVSTCRRLRWNVPTTFGNLVW